MLSYRSWSGYAFESICWGHSTALVHLLAPASAISITSWRYYPETPQDQGAQIAMIIERSDDSLMLCEMKYTQEPFILSKAEALELQKKEAIFRKQTKMKKQIFCALITSSGAKKKPCTWKIW